eukprot:s141_g14.t1
MGQRCSCFAGLAIPSRVPVKDASRTTASLAAPKKAALKQVPSPAEVERKVDVAQSRRQLRRSYLYGSGGLIV